MGSLIQSLCVDCYLEKNKVIDFPEKMKIDLDKHSGKIRLGRLWVESTDANLQGFLFDKIATKMKAKLLPIKFSKMEFTRGERSIQADITLDTVIEGADVTLKRKVILELASTISDASMKLSSNYHEAIIQARFDKDLTTPSQAKEKVDEILLLLFKYKKKNDLSEAVDIKKVRGGADLYVASKKYARKVVEELAKKYQTKVTYSNKLLGMKDGHEYYRDYLCIRF